MLSREEAEKPLLLGGYMSKYNEEGNCPRCGGFAPTTYTTVVEAVLSRTCLKCGYWWNEQLLDTEEEK